MWNFDEIDLEDERNYGMRVIAKRGKRNVPKSLP